MKVGDVRRAVLYARVSSRKRSQDLSPRRQLEQLGAYARARGWSVAGSFTDKASGRTLEREGLAAALAMLRERKADVLLVVDLDRLGRNLADVIRMTEDLQRWGAGLVILRFGDGDVDTTSSQGRLFFQIVGAFSEFLSNLHGEKIRDGLAAARAHGRRPGPLRSVPLLHARMVRGWRRLGFSWSRCQALLASSGAGKRRDHHVSAIRRAVKALSKSPSKTADRKAGKQALGRKAA